MKGEVELDSLIFIFKGHTTKVKGKIPRQLVHPEKINLKSRRVQAYLECERKSRKQLVSFGFDRYMVCDRNSPAAILFGKANDRTKKE